MPLKTVLGIDVNITLDLSRILVTANFQVQMNASFIDCYVKF